MIENKVKEVVDVTMINDMYRTGDVLLIAIPNYLGHQQGGTRYAIVVSNNIGNKYSPTIKVMLGTSNAEKYNKSQLTHAKFKTGEIKGLYKNTVFMAESELVINKFQVIKKVSTLSDEQLTQIAIAKAYADPMVFKAFETGLADNPRFQNIREA